MRNLSPSARQVVKDLAGVRGELSKIRRSVQESFFRRIADDEGIVTLPIPGNVGGRFSVLAAVGLLPAAMVGIDLDALLAGGAAMVERCDTDELEENPAGLFAALQWLAHTEAGAAVHVMMPYSDRLYSVADWFRQIWAESLGKRKSLTGEDVWVGPTPVKALGATDQHSQVQLYIEGPFDKTITFLAVDRHERDVPIPPAYSSTTEATMTSPRNRIFSARRISSAEIAAAVTQIDRCEVVESQPRVARVCRSAW